MVFKIKYLIKRLGYSDIVLNYIYIILQASVQYLHILYNKNKHLDMLENKFN